MVANESKKLYFYRHDDGNPTEEIPSLFSFIEWLNKKTKEEARWNDPTQIAGWLVVWGRKEFLENKELFQKTTSYDVMKGYYWKVGCYQPNDSITSDSVWVYLIRDGVLFYGKNCPLEDDIDWKFATEFKGEK